MLRLSQDPEIIRQLPLELHPKAMEMSSALFAGRLTKKLFVLPIVLAVVTFDTDYRTAHTTVFGWFVAAVVIGIALRVLLIRRREAICRRSIELWSWCIAGTIILLGGAPGFLLAHSVRTHGLADWNSTILMIWTLGMVAGSVVSYSANYNLLRLQLCLLLCPALTATLWDYNSQALQLALGAAGLLAFGLLQGSLSSDDHWNTLYHKLLGEWRAKELEAARSAADDARRRAEHAMRARTDSLANMSHEIRTPMNAVMGMTSLILDQDLPAETLDYVNIIRSSSDALLTIINDILDFSKIESGKLDLEHEPFCLRDCVEEVLELLAPKADETHIELAADVHHNVSEWIYGDAARLRQILVNLASNALKFTPQGEVIVEVNLSNSRSLHFKVRDTGIGIAHDKISSLFQAFSQAESSTTRRFGGTGLGLAISKHLAELMGGNIQVSSQLGKGSVFKFEIPYEPAPTQRPSAAGRADWTDKRILIVDDNATNRLILTGYLERWKLSVTSVGSALEALHCLRQERWDAVITDWCMPDVDGADLARIVRTEWGASAPPVIMLTSSSASLKEVFAGERNPVAALLAKPVRRNHLHRVLGQVLSGLPDRRQTSRSGKLFDNTFASRAPLRILLAEDNAVNQKLAIRLLERLGYRPDAVNNGREVLSALARESYDIILMDVQMPEMDGLEATRQVIATWGDERPWITALTAGAMKENRDECLAAGVDDFLTKPINLAEMERSLALCYSRVRSKSAKQFPEPLPSLETVPYELLPPQRGS